MKKSHYTTPRTRAECEFQGVRYAPQAEKRTRWYHVVITLVAMATIGAILAYRG